MTSRLLPHREWSRLQGTDLGEVLPLCDPETTRVLVVEEEDGAIIGCWAFLTIIHAEGVWIAPQHRGKTSVARRLWSGMQTLLRGKVTAVLTGAQDDTIRALLEAHGAVAIPPVYRLPIG